MLRSVLFFFIVNPPLIYSAQVILLADIIMSLLKHVNRNAGEFYMCSSDIGSILRRFNLSRNACTEVRKQSLSKKSQG